MGFSKQRPRRTDHRKKEEKLARLFAPGFLYAMQRDKDFAIKIGFSQDPSQRFRNQRSGYRLHEYRLRLLAIAQVQSMRRDEVSAHMRLSRHRVSGEWFQVSEPESLTLLKSLASGYLLVFTDADFIPFVYA